MQINPNNLLSGIRFHPRGLLEIANDYMSTPSIPPGSDRILSVDGVRIAPPEDVDARSVPLVKSQTLKRAEDLLIEAGAGSSWWANILGYAKAALLDGDGEIPASLDNDTAAGELIAAGLWERLDDPRVYRLHPAYSRSGHKARVIRRWQEAPAPARDEPRRAGWS
ncbi:MAG: hypothetical protein WCG47_01900 [Dermatophilaceae bacterium]